MKRILCSKILIPVAVLMLCISSCQRVKEEIIPSSEFAPFVSAYTGGVVSSYSSIKVELAEASDMAELGAEVKEKLFTFTPSLKGKTYWVDSRTIEFVPDSATLKPGTLYKTSFALGKLMKVDKNLEKFEFTFRVQERNFAVKIDPIDISENNPHSVTINGDIRLSDKADEAQIVKMFTVKRKKENFTVTLTKTDNPLHYRFSIANIMKQEPSSYVKIALSGKSIGSDKKEEMEVYIPSLSEFKLLNTEIIMEPEYGACLTFTKPLDTEQDLEGMIVVEAGKEYISQIEGNKVKLFFEKPKNQNSIRVYIYEGFKSWEGDVLPASISESLSVSSLHPKIELKTKGTILPNAEELILPFRAVNLYAVDVKVIKIFESNVLMFLQSNKLSQNSENDLRRVGRLVYRRMIRLDNDVTKNIHEWEDYYIDLSKMFKQEPGAIYRIELSFNQRYSAYPCGNKNMLADLSDNTLLTKVGAGDMTEEEEAVWDKPQIYYYGYDDDWDWENYDWYERDNPCHPTYYMQSHCKTAINLLASNLGVIVKENKQNQLWVAVTNILDTKPISGAEVTAYNFQLQPIGKGKTDQDGFATIKAKGKPFVLVASSGNQKAYIRLVDGEDNMLSRFDVGGKEIEKGLKGFIYGERGVWRPGDTLYLSFMLEDRENKIPNNHPVAIELYNPRGQFHYKQISTNGLNGLYTFKIPTQTEDPTGIWNAYVKVGGASFHKSLRIETIKPNRLKINLTIPEEGIAVEKGKVPLKVDVAWLTGVTAKNLKTKVEMTLSKNNSGFKGFEKYIFQDPASRFTTTTLSLHEGVLNEQGTLSTNINVPKAKDAPGMLHANILCTVLESGGDASLYSQTVPFSPYPAYVGIHFNKAENKYYFETDKQYTFDVVTVDAKGRLVNRSDLEYKIYKIGWSWWWDSSEDSYNAYIHTSSMSPVKTEKFVTKDGRAQIKFKVKDEDWGRYLVYVKDRDGGHATGGAIFFDSPGWRGRSDGGDPNALKMLAFSTDKSSYETGEKVTVMIPSSEGGRALITLENGSEVLHKDWIQMPKNGEAKYQFTASENMAPNVYVHVSLLQPHNQTANDLPIRMYGVIPVFVNHKGSKLAPQITMPDVLRPEKEFTVKVKEKEGKPMTYTLAIVDEGLLDLTNFKTPDPWNAFYAREALGIKTWDMYDNVIGAFTGKYGSLFSIGGDEGGMTGAAKANRFKPVVRFMGAFALKKGEEKSHAITLPPYIGSVRVMVVACQDGAYGNAEKRAPVRNPLMILSSLPRVVSTDEEILLPVNVFAMENSVKNVNLKVTTTGKLQLKGESSQNVSFSATGDKMLYFSLKSADKIGVEKITITATGNGQTVKEVIEIEVRNPNPPVTQVESHLLNAGESIEIPYALESSYKENSLQLEVARIPTMNISARLDFLYDYHHYCSEQLVSKALPLLYISLFKEVDKNESEWIKKNVRKAIEQLYGRQLSNGGFAYWSGQGFANEWISSYAGIFLIQAKEKGYEVNSGVINRWKTYQRTMARNWRNDNRTYSRYYYTQSDLEQSYRLYSLALAGEAEMGAMNRMKEMQDISLQTKWRLAAAYVLAGKKRAAEELILNAATDVAAYSANNNTYGSSDRDEAMILETLLLLGREQEAFKQAQKIADRLSKERYYSTQSTAYALMAMGRLAEKMSGTLDFEWSQTGAKATAVKSAKAIYQKELSLSPSQGKVTIKNNGKGMLYVSVVSKTRPLRDETPPMQNGIKMEVHYTTLNGKSIDIANLKQGTDFVALVKISNLSGSENYTDVALTHIIPSGWEIHNERLFAAEEESQNKFYTYQDIRDDRVLTYFDLPAGKSIEIKVRLMAAYSGVFVLPAIQCEAMYNPTVLARSKAGRVSVQR